MKKKTLHSEKITTTVSPEMWDSFHKVNRTLSREDKITWAECIRRGYNSLRAERENLTITEILENTDIVPLQVKERIRVLSQKFGEAYKDISKLKQQAGIIEKKAGVDS